jgi:hypothetical protein
MRIILLLLLSGGVYGAEITSGCDYEEIVFEVEIPYVP